MERWLYEPGILWSLLRIDSEKQNIIDVTWDIKLYKVSKISIPVWGVTLTVSDHFVQLGAKNAVQGLLR